VKVLTFPAYNRVEKDDMGRPAVAARAFWIAFLAVSQAPSGPNAERSSQVHNIYRAFKSLLKMEGVGTDQERFLNPEGGSFVLEEVEIKVLKEIIDGFRQNVTGAGSDSLVYLDQLIANAPEQPKVVN
jgi:hypothetical protein